MSGITTILTTEQAVALQNQRLCMLEARFRIDLELPKCDIGDFCFFPKFEESFESRFFSGFLARNFKDYRHCFYDSRLW